MDFSHVLGIVAGAFLFVLGVWTLIVVWQPDALGGRIEGLYDRLSFMRSEEVRQRRRANRRQHHGYAVAYGAVMTALGLWQLLLWLSIATSVGR
jgi:hypothetical protein